MSKKMKRRRRNERRLKFEKLAARQLLAADIPLTSVPGLDSANEQPAALTADSDASEVSSINAGVLDITGSGKPNPFQDGILILRYMFELGAEDLEGLSPAGAPRTDGAEVLEFLNEFRAALDVNGDGAINPFQDGILILRYLFQLGDEDLEGLSPAGSTRTTGEEIRLYLDTLMPGSGNRRPITSPLSFDVQNRPEGSTEVSGLNVPAESGLVQQASDPDGDSLSVSIDTGSQNGTVFLDPDGSFFYVPNAGFLGQDSFSYVVSDGKTSTIGTVDISVLPVHLDSVEAERNGNNLLIIEGTSRDDHVWCKELATKSK